MSRRSLSSVIVEGGSGVCTSSEGWADRSDEGASGDWCIDRTKQNIDSKQYCLFRELGHETIKSSGSWIRLF